MSKSLRIGNLILFVVIVFSCKKDGTVIDNKVVPGSIYFEVHAMHHTWDVPGMKVYLKKNATEFPGKDSTLYEYNGTTDGYGKYTFEKLYPGNYYLYASGYDSTWGANVTGSTAINLNSNNVVDDQAKYILIVSE